MQPAGKGNCEECNLKCDLYLTAREMNLTGEMVPVYNRYRKHELICREGEEVVQAIIILEGYAKMFIEGISGRSIILSILIPSNYIGLMAVFGSTLYKYNVAALSDCLTCSIPIETIRKMYIENGTFMERLNIQISGSMSLMMSKLVSLNQKQVRGKVAESLLYLSDLFESDRFTMPVTRRELGELSAISEENAVRVLTELRNEEIIDVAGRVVTIRDRSLLKRISAIG